MALGLVARATVALSDSINAYYRVLKGTDPESIALRLPTGGFFQVRHSGTNAAVFSVTDAGVAGIIQGGDIVDNTITSAEIANDTIVDGDISPSAAIAVTKLAHVGANNVLKSNGTANVGAQVVDADVAPAAAVAITKIAHVGAGNVLKSNGTTANVAGQIVNADVSASAAIAYSKLNLANSITSGDIAVDTIVNSDVNSAAAIAYGKLNLASAIVNADVATAAAIGLAKLAHVGANNVLKSNGAANVGSQIVNADIAAGADIDGAKMLNGSITASKLGAGITAPAVALLATSGVLGAPQAVFDFTPISGAYTSLELRIYGRSTAANVAEGVKVQCNSDATATYYTQVGYATAASLLAAETLGATSADIGTVPAASASTANWFGAVTAWLHGYTNATRWKPVHALSSFGFAAATGSIQVSMKGSVWTGGPGAITRIVVFPASGQWAAGSVAQLYGYI